MVYQMTDTYKISHLFAGWEETLIWSCLQRVMGKIYVSNTLIPESAIAVIGDFCFLAGAEDEELVRCVPDICRNDFIIMVPQNEKWSKLIEACYNDRASKVFRYATRKEPECFDIKRLQELTETISGEYSLVMIDERLFEYCRQKPWCHDFVSQYDTYEIYRKNGIGVMALLNGEPVAGASSYSYYRDGIEIEIDTREEFRRKGLACTCGAKLILECIKRGLYPSWDAQNLWSLALAGKLGYNFSHQYTAYELRR